MTTLEPRSSKASILHLARLDNTITQIKVNPDQSDDQIHVKVDGSELLAFGFRIEMMQDTLRIWGTAWSRSASLSHLEITLPAKTKINVSGTWHKLLIGKMESEVNISSYASGPLYIDSMIGGSVNVIGGAQQGVYSISQAEGDLSLMVRNARFKIYQASIDHLDIDAERAQVEVLGSVKTARLSVNSGQIKVESLDPEYAAQYPGLDGEILLGFKQKPNVVA